MPAVLVVDDTPGFHAVQQVLQPQGFELCHTEGFARSCRLCRDRRFDLGLIDFRLGTANSAHTGLDLLQELSPQFPAIILSEVTDAPQLRASLCGSVPQYLFKPVTEERLLPLVRSTLATATLPLPLQRLVGTSSAMAELRARIQAVAPRPVRVLIVGASGSGKELVARAIHGLSPRHAGPFVGVNCAALPRELVESELFGYERGAFTGASSRRRGLFELAHRGTLFLDEIEELAPEAQAKLLRVLEDLHFRRVGGEEELDVDVRVIAASNQDLRRRMAAGQFRDDLFHRLSVVTLTVPALGERHSDIPQLVRFFLHEFGAESLQLSAAALSQLERYAWPGNVRELRNVIERTIVFATGGEIAAFDLGLHSGAAATVARPSSVQHAVSNLSTAFTNAVRAGNTPRGLLSAIERSLAETALSLASGNKTAAARWLDLDRKALDRRLRRGEPNQCSAPTPAMAEATEPAPGANDNRR
ncbi:MAG: sigma-54-dependent Fis family transcriptional regulator [Deltaproteobacteria bacterium]|nr:sigma-54-dependent Fis family transcriptional regulator [Deltaproteobacteria bacterium]